VAAFATLPATPQHGYYRKDGSFVELKPSYADGTLLQNGDLSVYVVQDGVRHCIPDPATLKIMGFDPAKIFHVTEYELQQIPEGQSFRSLAFEN
jgi:hypothetical protein